MGQNLKCLFNEFLKHLKYVRSFSNNTLIAYEGDLKKLFSFMDENDIDHPGKLESKHFEQFIKGLKVRLQDSSISRAMFSIRSFFKFLFQEGEIGSECWRNLKYFGVPKAWSKVPVILSQEEMGGLIESIDTSTKLGFLKKLILEMLYGSGIRVSELCSLTVGCVHLKEKYLFIRHGKGGKDRTTPIGKRHVKMLKEYWQKYRGNLDDDDYAIVSMRGTKLDRVNLFRLIRKITANSVIDKKISAVTFRHCFATHLLENGATIRVIQEMLGHENIEDTERYLTLSMEYIKRKFDKYHPSSEKIK